MTRLQEIRERLRLTQEQMAAGIGCSQGNVWQIEQKGQRLLPERAEKVIAFCAAHGLVLTMDQVYGREPLPPKTKKRAKAVTQLAQSPEAKKAALRDDTDFSQSLDPSCKG